MAEKFEIIINIPVPQPFKFWVECSFISKQVKRYRVHHGTRYVTIENRLQERQGWKVTGASYREFQAERFMPFFSQVIRAIEIFESPIQKPYENPKNADNGITEAQRPGWE
jgi:hypothetical protein